MTGKVPIGAEVEVRCDGHKARDGRIVRARIVKAVHVGREWSGGEAPRWQLRERNGVRIASHTPNGNLGMPEVRADGTLVGPPLPAVESISDHTISLRCRGCLSRGDAVGGDVQVAGNDVLSDVLDRVALAGVRRLNLSDLERLLEVEKRAR